MQVRRQAVRLGLVATAALVVLAAACNDDGRDMRQPVLPPPPSTTAAPSTAPANEALLTAPTTTFVPAFQAVTAWPNGAAIPERHTCDDANVAPAISWTSVPTDAVDLAVTMTDLDRGFTHWLMTGISPTRTSLAEARCRPGRSCGPMTSAMPPTGGRARPRAMPPIRT